MKITRRTFVSGVAVTGVSAFLGMTSCSPATQDEPSNAMTSTADDAIGTADGVGGELTLQLKTSGEELAAVEKVVYAETDGLGSAAWDQMVAEMVEHQTVEVDTVSGATMSSSAILAAAKEAVESGQLDILLENSYKRVEESQENMDVDVVVVGAGIAGLMAAASATDLGLSTIVLERTGIIGGTALRSSSFVGPTGSARDLAKGEETIIQLESYGIPLEQGTFQSIDGKSRPYSAIKVFTELLADSNTPILINTSCTGLIVENDRVVGATAQPLGRDEFTIQAKGVIVAAGGFARNPDMVKEYLPDYVGITTSSTPGSTGDIYTWAEENKLSFSTSKMNGGMQMYPLSVPHMTHTYPAESMPLNVDAHGETFSDYGIDMYTMVAYKASQTDPHATYYAIYSDEEVDMYQDMRKTLDHYVEIGEIFEYPSLDDAAEDLGLTNLSQSAEGTALVDAEGPFYVLPWSPTMYSTWGGIDVDEGARALSSNGTPIPGLYLAGETAGSEAFKENGTYMGQLFAGMVMARDAATALASDIE